MAGRASIVGAAETSVGKVRDHNEDAHFIDPEAGIFVVCDGMGGHAAGEVASALAVRTVRTRWGSDGMQAVADRWLAQGTPEARKQLLATVQQGVLAAHDAIVEAASADRGKTGMGTTIVAAIVVGGDIVFAHSGDSRAYMVRDGIAMQLTEDHTLLARLLAAGVDVDVDGDGLRFKSMLTNALGIGEECKVSTFVVPVADGDRFLLCSDGITEYVKEYEIGEVLSTMPSPARSAQRLVEMALQRGGGDNATALVVRVLEAGETARPSEHLRREEQAIFACPLWGRVNPQQRLRALRIALPRDYPIGDKVPAQTLGDRVAWIIVEGELEQNGHLRGPGSLLYPEALLADRPLPDKDGLAVAQSEIRALALRADDFRELCEDDPELGEILLEALALEISVRRPQRRTGKIPVQFDDRGTTDPGDDGTKPTLELKTLDPVTGEPVTTEPAKPTPPVTIPAIVEHKRQPRGSTVPPTYVRAKTNTDRGTPVAAAPSADAPAPPPRMQTADPLPPAPERPSSPRLHPRGSTPPLGTSNSLIVPQTEQADTDAELDRAFADSTTARTPKPAKPDDDAEIILEVDEPQEPVRAQAPVARGPHLSEPEIQIEELAEEAEAEAVAAAPPQAKQVAAAPPQAKQVADDDDEMEMTVEPGQDDSDEPVIELGAAPTVAEDHDEPVIELGAAPAVAEDHDEPEMSVEPGEAEEPAQHATAADVVAAAEDATDAAEDAEGAVAALLEAPSVEADEPAQDAAAAGDAGADGVAIERHSVEIDEADVVEAIDVSKDEEGRIVEVLKETSSQTITLSIAEPSEPEIVVAPQVATDAAGKPRAKRLTDEWDAD